MTGDEHRRRENRDIIERMKRGETLVKTDVMSTWFPPRPIVKKDKREMARIYGDKDGDT